MLATWTRSLPIGIVKAVEFYFPFVDEDVSGRNLDYHSFESTGDRVQERST